MMGGDKKIQNPGFNLNSSLLGNNLQAQPNFGGNGLFKMNNDNLANSQQNAALHLLQMANLAKASENISVKHEDEHKDQDKKWGFLYEMKKFVV